MKKQIILATVALVALFGAHAGSAQAAMGNMASAKNTVAAETLTKVSRRHGRGHGHRGHRRHRWHRPYYVGHGCGFYWGKWKYTGKYYWLEQYKAKRITRHPNYHQEFAEFQ